MMTKDMNVNTTNISILRHHGKKWEENPHSRKPKFDKSRVFFQYFVEKIWLQTSTSTRSKNIKSNKYSPNHCRK